MHPDRAWDAAVVDAHPELPGLGVLLDDAALAALLGTPSARVDRLRLKPGVSARAAVDLGPAGWAVVHCYAPRTWAHKAGKDVAARRLPLHVSTPLRLVALPMAADRRLAMLAALRPDSGRRPATVARAVLGLDGIRRLRATTLAHNPARRWVGRLDGPAQPLVLKVFASVAPAAAAPYATGLLRRADVPVLEVETPPEAPTLQVMPYVCGRAAAAADADVVADVVARLERADPRGLPAWSVDAESVRASVRALGWLDPQRGARAAALARSLLGDARGGIPVVGSAGRVASHGDLSPDQVLVTADGPVLLDLDRACAGPVGWDAATWLVAQLATDPGRPARPLPGTLPGRPADDRLVATAALLRLGEPFRRRRAGRAAATDALLDLAAGRLGVERSAS